MTELAETIAGIIKDHEEIKKGIGDVGSVAYKFQLFPESNILEDTWCQISTRELGSSFILSHLEHGILGSIADQPYLGDSMGTWIPTRVVSTGSIFNEWFDTTTLKDTGTGWVGTGSVVISSGTSAISKLVYFDSTGITNSRFNVGNIDVDSTLYLSANSGTDWETVNNGSIHTFTITGSALRWKITAGSDLVYSGLSIEYNL